MLTLAMLMILGQQPSPIVQMNEPVIKWEATRDSTMCLLPSSSDGVSRWGPCPPSPEQRIADLEKRVKELELREARLIKVMAEWIKELLQERAK